MSYKYNNIVDIIGIENGCTSVIQGSVLFVVVFYALFFPLVITCIVCSLFISVFMCHAFLKIDWNNM